MYVVLLLRITPADAGKTFCAGLWHNYRWDHPRGCGENVADVPFKVFAIGSPPRMRGKRIEKISCSAGRGITPADAGKTLVSAWSKVDNKDHPRGCGENYAFSACVISLKGSPPRMRGKLCIPA